MKVRPMFVTPVINLISQRSLKSFETRLKKSLKVFEFFGSLRILCNDNLCSERSYKRCVQHYTRIPFS